MLYSKYWDTTMHRVGSNYHKNIARKGDFAPIAQLAEQIPLKDKVAGSIPAGGTQTLYKSNKI